MSDPLANSPLSWKRVGVDRLQITHEGRPVSVVNSSNAKATIERLQTASDAEAQQLLAGLLSAGRRGKRR
jgi:hypothetical protein